MAKLLAQHVGRDADGTEFLLDTWSDGYTLSVRRPGENTWGPLIELKPQPVKEMTSGDIVALVQAVTACT